MDELAEITRHLLRFSPDALVVVDDRGRICFANDTVTSLFGYDARQLLDQSIDLLVPERLRSHHGHFISGFFREPRSREMGAAMPELFARRADGSEFAAGIRLAPFKVGDRVLVAAAIRDDTERRRINQALIVAREAALRADRAKSRFLATASHDLRQPLQTIRLLNAAMSRLGGPAELGTFLEHQEQAIENMTRLLNSLLDISRLESGAIEPQCVPVSLPELFDELHAEFDCVAAARGLELNMRAAAVCVHTDRVLFHQLLQNVLSNAFKYTDRGSVSIECSQQDDHFTIRVSDTGIGIAPDKLERVFDEYYQVDNRGTKRMGVGLGLAIVKEVARLLAFEVRIASQLGQRTEVQVCIPGQYVSASSPVRARAPIEPAKEVMRESTRILLVEDNDGVRVATELFLKLEGYRTRSAGSFVDALELLPSMQPGDLLITDFRLDSSHSGLDVILEARRICGAEVPGIVLSGDLPAVVRSMPNPVAAVRFLGKPVDTKALLHAIRELSGDSRYTGLKDLATAS